MRHPLWIVLCAAVFFGLLGGCTSRDEEPTVIEKKAFEDRSMPKRPFSAPKP